MDAVGQSALHKKVDACTTASTCQLHFNDKARHCQALPLCARSPRDTQQALSMKQMCRDARE